MDHPNPDPNRSHESPAPPRSPTPTPSSDLRPAAVQVTGKAPASPGSLLRQPANDSSGGPIMSVPGLEMPPAKQDRSELVLANRAIGCYYPEHDQMCAMTPLNLDRHRRGSDKARKKDEVSAEQQSRKYSSILEAIRLLSILRAHNWYKEYKVIDYDEKVLDGFCDVHAICTDSRLRGTMPSLTDLETDPGSSGFEAIVVNRKSDHALQNLMQIAHCIQSQCPATEVTILVQRLAELVTGNMGGLVEDADIMWARWVERTTELRTSLQTSVLPIGFINVGLSSHRALLFKVLADSINLPCQLVKGNHYTGVEDDAVNLIKLDDEREYLVDLMASPGTLIPAGFCSGKDNNPYNGKISKLPSFQSPNDLEVVQSRPQTLAGEQSSQSSVMETDSYVDIKSSSKTSESFPSFPFASHDPGVGSSSVSGGTTQQLNVIVVPHRKNSSEDPTNLFADLYPFAAKVFGKAPVEGNSPEIKINEMPRQKNNPVHGRPRVPLMPKNQHPLNEVARKKEYGSKEGLFSRSNQELNAYDVSSSIGISTTDKVNPDRVSGGRAQQLNVNEVLRNKYSSKYPTNLSGDPYPFLMVGFRKALGSSTEIKINEMLRQKNNPIPGRPPVPLMPKNRHPLKEVAGKEEYVFKEGLSPKSDREPNAYDVSSSIGSSTTDKVNPDSFKLSNNLNHSTQESSRIKLSNRSNQLIKESSHWNPFSENSAMLGCSTGQYGMMPREDHLNARVREDPLRTLENLQDGVADSQSRRGSHEIGFPDLKKCTNDRFMDTNFMLKDSQSPSSSINSNTIKDDQVLDDVDVGDEIRWEHLVIGERIGLGSYGEVFHADWNGTEVAVKKFLDQDFSGAALDELRREVRIIRRLRHPNVVLFMGAVTCPPHLSIITEFLPRGSLYRIIHRPHCEIDEKRRIKMALDVTRGMNCLHTSVPTIVHRDLKSQNLLVDKNWNVKVCDFGMSRLKHNTFLSSKSTAGTAEWMAPEVLRNESLNEKCDVYSFGVILWELATLRLPWDGMNPMQVVGAVGFQNRRLEIPREVDPLVGKIIWECWQTEPNLRPSFAELTVDLESLQRLVIPS